MDGLAVALMLVAWLGIGSLIDNPSKTRASVSTLMAGYRRTWLRQHVSRNPRVFDAILLTNLRQGTAFFASACLVVIGGGLALFREPELLASLATDLALEEASRAQLDARLLIVMLFLVNALLKFVWSHRLFGYCAVVMASIPNDTGPGAYALAEQAAEINISAARAFNRGLRSVYFALGALAGLLGPLALIGATLVTAAVLWRREFASASRRNLIAGIEHLGE